MHYNIRAAMYLLSGFVSACKQSTPRAAYTDDVISACFFQELSISAEGERERERESKGISIRGSAAAASEPATYLLQLSCDAAVGRIVGLLSLQTKQACPQFSGNFKFRENWHTHLCSAPYNKTHTNTRDRCAVRPPGGISVQDSENAFFYIKRKHS